MRVSSILEGSVRKSGSRLRVTAQLIDVESEGHIWAKSYDRELNDVFAVQGELAEQVAEALKLELRPSERARLDARPGTATESYLAYLKGRSLLQSVWSEQAFRGAKQQFELALSIDETNARAHAGLADAILQLGWGHFRRTGDESNRVARTHIDRALALDPYLAEAHCSLSHALWEDLAIPEIEKELQLALSLNPSYAPAHFSYGSLLLELGRPEEGLKEIVLAEELDPDSIQYLNWHTWTLLMLRRLDEAAVVLERLKQKDTRTLTYLSDLCYYHYARSDFERALQVADRIDELEPGESSDQRVWIWAALGKPEEAWRLIRAEEAQPTKRRAVELATLHAVVGDLDVCFQYLDKAVEEHDLSTQFWRNEPALAPVRQDARFGQLMRRLNLA